jgi:hypothetical protein
MIARELLVKLGFDIDSTKLDKFNASIDATKNKMQSIRNSSLQGVSSVGGSKLANAVSQQTGKYQFASALTKEELLPEKELIRLNKIENQAIKETTKVEKAELKERQRFAREQFKEKQILQRSEERGFKTSMASMSRVARKFAIIGASITAGFGLSLRSTLKDAANFKEGKSSSSFDKSQIATVDSFNRSLNTTGSLVANLRNSFVVDMLPAIKEVLDIFNKWLTENKVRILKKLTETAEAITEAFKMLKIILSPVLSAFDYLIEKTVGWKTLIKYVIVLGASAWFMRLAGSIFMVARAFKTLMGATVIGGFISSFKTIRAIGMVGWFKSLAGPMLRVANGFKNFLRVNLVTAALGLLIEEIYLTIQGGDTLINRFLESEAWDSAKNKIKGITDSLKKMAKAMGMSQKTEFAQRKEKERLLNYQNSEGKFGKGNVKVITLEKSLFGAPFKPKPSFKPLSFPEYDPFDRGRDYIRNKSQPKENNINNKNSVVFNTTVNVPAGTNQEQVFNIEKIVKSQLEKQQEQLLATVGSYR